MNSNPQLRAMADSNPEIRSMLSNPEAMRAMMNPETMGAMVNMQRVRAFLGFGMNRPHDHLLCHISQVLRHGHNRVCK